jgi:hypothetical protein
MLINFNKFLLLVSFFCFSTVVNAQTTVSTTTNFTNNNGSGLVTFNFQNTNSYDIIINSIDGVTGSAGSIPVEFWYKTTPVSGFLVLFL